MELAKSLQQFVSRHLTLNVIPSRALLFANKTFREQYRFLRESESWSTSDVRAWQTERVRAQLQSAYAHSPMYKDLYDAAGVHPDAMHTLDDLRVFPTIDKETVKRHGDSAENEVIPPAEKVYRYTGGSTGPPMRFALDKQKIFQEKAFFYFINEKYGYLMGEKCVLMKGENVFDQFGTVARFDPFLNYLKLDSAHLSERNRFPEYHAAIEKFGSQRVLGYPSAIYQLALLYQKSNITPPNFEHIMFASENTYADQTRFITEVFGAKSVFFHYGHSEYAALAYKYTGSDHLGFSPFYGHTEILDEGGVPAQAGEKGEIVATGYSHAQPFIRYRTNDFAVVSDEQSEDFMRSYLPVEVIEGRLQEYIVTRDRRLVSICTMAAAHFSGLEDVYDSQYVQEREGEVFFDVVCDADRFSRSMRKSIEDIVERKLEQTVDVTVRRVESIERTQLGKKRMISQQLDVSAYL